MAIGEVMNQRRRQVGLHHVAELPCRQGYGAGVKATFKGDVKGTDFTKWGKDAQLDFSAELAKAKASGAEALFVFYPGKAGGAFVKQFGQAGLNDSMKLYTVFTVDGISLPKFQKAGMKQVLGALDTMHWSPDMDNEQNKKFVADYRRSTATIRASTRPRPMTRSTSSKRRRSRER